MFVVGDEVLVVEIVEYFEVVWYLKGYVLINYGDEIDDVYFVIFGFVYIFINLCFIDIRSILEIVGEMVVMKLGEVRLVDVVVDFDVFEVWVMLVSKFCEIIRLYLDFYGWFIDFVDKVGCKNFWLLGEKIFRLGFLWILKSVIVGFVVGIFVCVGIWVMGLGILYYFFVGLLLVVVVFVGVFLVNLELCY